MSSSNNIFSTRGLTPQPFKAGESHKDSSGMGGGGMYFSQRRHQPEEEEQKEPEIYEEPFDVALEDMDKKLFVISKPALTTMQRWKAVVAGQIYRDLNRPEPPEPDKESEAQEL